MGADYNDSLSVIDLRLSALSALENAIRSDQDSWHWKKLREYAKALFDRAPFRSGDRVRLVRNPEISEAKSPGWMCAKHFLVKGALGTVQCVDFCGGLFNASIVWDDESWIANGQIHPIPRDQRHAFLHWEGHIERVLPDETD